MVELSAFAALEDIDPLEGLVQLGRPVGERADAGVWRLQMRSSVW